MEKKFKVAELFAGVGGFRIGMEGYGGKSSSSGFKEDFNSPFEVIWSNQWEPIGKRQYAAQVYKERFGDTELIVENINKIKISEIPEHDFLVGGFPCQDYSVANVGDNAKGIIGKNGVLWWSIHKILSEIKNKPKYLLFENVDRLLNSPSKQRGRDFALIVQSLNELGYGIEWRTIKASDYGMPQKRNRIYILGFLKGTKEYNSLNNFKIEEWAKNSILNVAFPINIERKTYNEFKINENSFLIFSNFNKENKKSIFHNGGFLINGTIKTVKCVSNYNGLKTLLGDIIEKDNIDPSFFIDDSELKKWIYLKGPKNEKRRKKNGFEYQYKEGQVGFPDSLNKPSRTIITSEGGSAPSRFKHVVEIEGKHRRLMPIELERLNMFPDNFTKSNNIDDNRRAFLMGNALVVGVIERIALIFNERH